MMRETMTNSTPYALMLGIVAMGLAGCVSSHGYFTDRGRDAADILTLDVGWGIGAKVRAGPVQAGLLVEKGIAGFRGGQCVVNGIDYNPALGENSFAQDEDFEIILIGGESFLSCTGTGVARRKDFVADNFLSGGGPFVYVEGRGERPWYYTGLEAVAGAGLTFRLGLNPGELLDFVLGWTTLDIFGDDLSAEE